MKWIMKDNARGEKLVRRQEIARRYSISVRLVDELRRRRILPFYRISKRGVRFCPEEVDEAFRRYRVNGIGE